MLFAIKLLYKFILECVWSFQTKKSMEVLFYRDCRGYSQYKQAICTKDGVNIDGPINVQQEWKFADAVTEYWNIH